jgi:hypothetical protein
MTTHASARRTRRPTPWADLITGLAVALAVGIVVLGAVLAIADDNTYDAQDYVRDLVLTLFALAALLYARAHIRERITTRVGAGDAIYDDPPG